MLNLNLKLKTQNSKHVFLLAFMVFLLLSLAEPCLAQGLRLPSMPSLPSRDESVAGGIKSPDSPEEEGSAARPGDFQESNVKTSSGSPGGIRNKIDNRPIGARIGAQIDNKNQADRRMQASGKSDKAEEPLPDEQPTPPKERKSRSLINPFSRKFFPSAAHLSI